MKTNELIKAINEGKADEMLLALYGEEDIAAQKIRYIKAIESFAELYGAEREVSAYSVAGRTATIPTIITVRSLQALSILISLL